MAGFEMSKIIVGIISYFGHTPEVRIKRRKIHSFQLRWFKRMGFTKDEVLVASQHYQSDEYWPNYATYLDCEFPNATLKPGAARNFLLQQFYNSDADWIILADNDSVLDSRNKGDIIQWLRDNDQDDVPCFVPVAPNVPGQGAWKDYFVDRSADLDSNWIFERGKTKTSFMFLKNLKKHYGFEQYFDEGQHFQSGEDWAFGIDLQIAGHRAMWCRNIILREIGGQKTSGTWKPAGSTMTHSHYQPILNNALATVYADNGIEIKNKQLSMRGFYKKYPQCNSDVWVPKSDVVDGLFDF